MKLQKADQRTQKQAQEMRERLALLKTKMREREKLRTKVSLYFSSQLCWHCDHSCILIAHCCCVFPPSLAPEGYRGHIGGSKA